MAYIYCADIYCDSCGEAIKEDLDQRGLTPADPSDEYTYDSDEYPKQVGDDGESDCPQHCGNHGECLEAIELDSGFKIGAPIGELTLDGVEYLREAIAEGGEVAEFWEEHYSDYLR
jgi:hypothetical protein